MVTTRKGIEMNQAFVAVLAVVLLAVLVIISISIFQSLSTSFNTDSASSSQTILSESTGTLSPIGSGITSSEVKANNDTWLEFDGVDDYVRTNIVSNSPFQTDDGFTLVAFINPNSTRPSGAPRIMGKENATSGSGGFYFSLKSNIPNVQLQLETAGTEVADSVNLGSFNKDYLVFATLNSTGWSYLYSNAQEVESDNIGSPSLFSNADNLTIGNWAGGDTRALNGSIYYAKIYNRTLSYQEILNIYNDFSSYPLPQNSSFKFSATGLATLQGIANNGTNIYVSDNSQIVMFNMSGTNITNFSHGIANYKYEDFVVVNNTVYATLSNHSNIPMGSKIQKLYANNLTLIETIDLAENIWIASMAYKDGLFWVTTTNDSLIYVYNSSFDLQTNYTFPVIGDQDTTSGFYGYSGFEWFGDYIFGNKHSSSTRQFDIAYWNGTGFIAIAANTYPISEDCNQGITYDSLNDKFYWACRVTTTVWESFNIDIFNSSENNTGLVLDYNLNENNGTIAHDVSGNSHDGIISGATWATDGILITLAAITDYTINPTTGLFTITNNDYSWSELLVTWSYTVTSDAGSAADSMIDQFANYPALVGLVGTIVFLGLIIGILVVSFVFGGSKDKP